MSNLYLWERYQECPPEAKKTIRGGKLNGMTDISPIWRYKALTEAFGVAGDGWGIDDTQFTVLDGAKGEKVVMCTLTLWHESNGRKNRVPGQGGAMLINTEKGELRTNDEAYKMAYTDAVSVACKQLGFAANVYWQGGADSKYARQTDDDPLGTGNTEKHLAPRGDVCEKCGAALTPGQKALAIQKYGRMLCPACQAKEGENA